MTREHMSREPEAKPSEERAGAITVDLSDAEWTRDIETRKFRYLMLEEGTMFELGDDDFYHLVAWPLARQDKSA